MNLTLHLVSDRRLRGSVTLNLGGDSKFFEPVAHTCVVTVGIVNL